MVERLLNLALIGGEPILYLLILLSMLSVMVVLERLLYYRKNASDVPAISNTLVENLNDGKVSECIESLSAFKGAETEVLIEGLNNFGKGRTVATELMESMALKQQQLLDRWLTVIGTIGSNAPFIGLLGTVLGIIKAFNDLAFNTEGGPSVVMSGIAEALVATAVGLLVAIPAVIFFNYFKNRQKIIMGNIAQVQRVMLAFIEEDNKEVN